MRILAIESSSQHSRVATYQYANPLSGDPAGIFETVCYGAGHRTDSGPNFRETSHCRTTTGAKDASSNPINSSKSLVPAIQGVLTAADLKLSDIGLVAVALGPGSFTGLRIGVVAAKTIAFAIGCDVVGVDVMDSLAFQASHWRSGSLQPSQLSQSFTIGVAVKIGRGEIGGASYVLSPGQTVPPNRIAELTVSKPESWLDSIASPAVITGNGVELLDEDTLVNRGLEVAPTAIRSPATDSIARLGLYKFLVHGGDDLWQLQPIYSRPSAAEEARSGLNV